MIRACLVALLLVAAGGCQPNPLAVFNRPDAAPGSELGPSSDTINPHPTEGGLGDAITYKDKCIPSNGGVEICDGLDNDCNGVVDDVNPLSLASDAKNCGKCGNVCSLPNAFAKCASNTCLIDKCAPGYFDINKDSKDGCEYACLPTNGGVEICDGNDNDCDGKIDNGFDTTKDAQNCGKCGNICSSDHAASASCVASVCQHGACDAGWVDLSTDQQAGCTYKCPQWPPAATDPCDGIDNNCNGKIDEDFVPGSACYNSVSGCDLKTGQCKGECKLGTASCPNGYVICAGELGPKPEVCDGLDNDCDGTVDNGFDKLNDPHYCGGCTACAIPNAIAKCVTGQCAIAACLTGWVDLNKTLSDGCEYKCTPTGPEICDGLDNDCNGLIDTNDPGLAKLGANPCAQVGACTGATASCQGSSGWVCAYGADVELKKCATDGDCISTSCVGGVCPACAGGFCPGVLAPDETRCDNKDNNCNGLVDESFTNKGKPCTDSGKGICQGSGTNICNAKGDAITCNVTTPGKTATNEICNGLDDDCDGLVDEPTDDAAGLGVHDAMVHIARTYKAKAYDFYVYTYEASRPDATLSSAGAMTSRSCSKSGVLPGASVTYAAALAACTAAGKRLCTATEWLLACSGAPADPTGCTTTAGDGCYYPYSDTYDVTKCNGKAHLTPDALVATGSLGSCKSPDVVYDLSGNLKEWTNDPQCLSTGGPCPGNPNPDGYTVRGGAYDTPFSGLRCDFTFDVAPPTFSFPNLGFRCCSDTAP